MILSHISAAEEACAKCAVLILDNEEAGTALGKEVAAEVAKKIAEKLGKAKGGQVGAPAGRLAGSEAAREAAKAEAAKSIDKIPGLITSSIPVSFSHLRIYL